MYLVLIQREILCVEESEEVSQRQLLYWVIDEEGPLQSKLDKSGKFISKKRN